MRVFAHFGPVCTCSWSLQIDKLRCAHNSLLFFVFFIFFSSWTQSSGDIVLNWASSWSVAEKRQKSLKVSGEKKCKKQRLKVLVVCEQVSAFFRAQKISHTERKIGFLLLLLLFAKTSEIERQVHDLSIRMCVCVCMCNAESVERKKRGKKVARFFIWSSSSSWKPSEQAQKGGRSNIELRASANFA